MVIGADLLIVGDSKRIIDVAVDMGIKVIGSVNIGEVAVDNDILLIPRKIEYDIDSLKPSRKIFIGYKPSRKIDARRAGKINNIALIFDSDNIALCDDRQVNVMIGKNNYIEIILRDLLDNGKFNRYLRYMIRCIYKAYRLGIPTILSSGARNEWELWHPNTLIMIEKLIVGRRGILSASWIEAIKKWNPKILSRYL